MTHTSMLWNAYFAIMMEPLDRGLGEQPASGGLSANRAIYTEESSSILRRRIAFVHASIRRSSAKLREGFKNSMISQTVDLYLVSVIHLRLSFLVGNVLEYKE
jgi:hypothetical protein